MPNMPSFPPSGMFLNSVRESSRSLRLAFDVSIKPESIKRLLLSTAFTTSFKRLSASHGLPLPLKFPSILAELNLISILSLLNFGSGYRVPLHTATGRGAWHTIHAFVFSLYLTSSVGGEDNLLGAKGMQAITDGKVAELMGVSVHVEKPHDTIPGLVIGEFGGPMYELVKLMTKTLNETGDVLVNMGYPDLGSFVLEALRASEGVRSKTNINAEADFVLERFVRAIPAFRDMAVVKGQPIYCFKKALFLLHAIDLRFGTASPTPFPVPHTSQIPIFADNVIPSLLIHLGVIDLSSSPAWLSSLFPDTASAESLTHLLAAVPDNVPKLLKEGPILTSDQAFILRAAAIDACEMIIEVARSLDESVLSKGEILDCIKEITLPSLDMWVWTVAKDRVDYRNLERLVQRDTVFF